MDDSAEMSSGRGDSGGESPTGCAQVRHGRRAWKVDVQARVVQLGVELDQLELRTSWLGGLPPDSRTLIAASAKRELVEACEVLHRRPGAVRAFFPGDDIEIAYSHVHSAEVYLSRLQTLQELRARAPYLAAKARSLLPDKSKRRKRIEDLAAPDGNIELLAPGVYELAFTQALKNLYEMGDQRYSQLRTFRNNLRLVGILLSIIVAGLVIIGNRAPDAVPLCFSPQDATQPDDVVQACPTHEERLVDTDTTRDATIVGDDSADRHGPREDDVLRVAYFSSLAASSGALGCDSFRLPSSTHNLPLYSFLFKLPVGAITAVGGLILITGQIVPGLSALDTQGQSPRLRPAARICATSLYPIS